MELLAVVEALAWTGGREAEVFTDSHYVAHGFNRALRGWKHNDWRYGKRKGRRPIRDADLWQALWSLHRNAPAKVSQIRRAIHVYNVEADQAAKEAMRRSIGVRTRSEQLLMHAIDNSLRGASN
jgi:ribonuclease HI